MRHLLLLRYLLVGILLLPGLLGAIGAIVTWNKLEKMKMIRGMKPGAIVKMKTVKQKLEDPVTGTFWIALTDEDIRRGGAHRLNLRAEKWDQLDIGDQVEIVYLPGSDWPYMRDGIFAEDGNFEFDYTLLTIEFVMMALSLLFALIAAGLLLLTGGWLKRTLGLSNP